MITILSALLGLFGSTLPSIMNYFQDKQDKKHELEILRMQMEAAKQGGTQKLKELEIEENIAEVNHIYDTYKTGVSWVDALNGTVRPVVAYLLIGLYCIMEFMYFSIISANSDHITIEMLDLLWTDEDHALFSCIIAFYFGSRHLKAKT